MKIGDVKIGTEYGAHDGPTRTRRWGMKHPRRVEALEIVTETQDRWASFNQSSTVNVRRVKVKMLDDTGNPSGWDKIERAAKDAVLVIDARQLVAEWSKLAPSITKAVELEEQKREAQEALNARVQALIPLDGRKRGHWYTTVNIYDGKLDCDLRVDSPYLEDLLALAEKGKAAT